MEGSSRGVIRVNVLAYAWKDRGKLLKGLVRRESPRAEILSQIIPNKKQD
jgi:hypothetical protein